METGIKDFCIKYKEKLKNDKDIKENQKDFLCDYRERINFNLNIHVTRPNSLWEMPHNGQKLFRLDEDDLEYLYKKYSKKIHEEMEQNISEIKDRYKDII